jgi:hypothetical protein
MLLIHGARSAMRAGAVLSEPDDLRTWARTVANRRPHTVAAVALANKLARICWRVWRDQGPFERRDPRQEGSPPASCTRITTMATGRTGGGRSRSPAWPLGPRPAMGSLRATDHRGQGHAPIHGPEIRRQSTPRRRR